MSDITIEHRPSPAKLDAMYVDSWDIWTKEVSTFPWTYSQNEICYILKGEATITPADGGEPVVIKKGDLVHFAKGLSCEWQITQDIKKHYQFS